MSLSRFSLFLSIGGLLGFGLASCTPKTACVSSAQCRLDSEVLEVGRMCGPERRVRDQR